MFARIRKAQENEDGGFTLIELLVVMIIIGILAAIAIPAFLSQKKKGYESSEKSDLRSIATEISTALVDQPALGTVAGTAPAANKATVTVKAGADAAAITAATDFATIALSPGNYVLAMTQPVTTGANAGAFCVALKNAGAGTDWRISSLGGAGATQVLATGTCPV